ncbi:MAG: hypothetical protein JWO40_570 [Candidatus Doudnabacteria bacterium]|nr:hypothetical protein [Candidatus Doudnabacteria bacterium]
MILKKLLKAFKLIAALCISVYLASFVYIISFAFKANVPDHADALLVLGAKVNLDNSPSQPLYERTNEAAVLYAQNKAEYIITTGGVGLGSIAESKIGEKVAEQKGVPKDKILEEVSSHNTFQNVEEGKKIAKEKNIKSVIVVSDRFHVARGVLVARYFGFDPVYWDFPSASYYKKTDLIRNYAREALAILFYVPKLYLSKS